MCLLAANFTGNATDRHSSLSNPTTFQTTRDVTCVMVGLMLSQRYRQRANSKYFLFKNSKVLNIQYLHRVLPRDWLVVDGLLYYRHVFIPKIHSFPCFFQLLWWAACQVLVAAAQRRPPWAEPCYISRSSSLP